MTSETGLKRLYRSNYTARALLDHFASRDRNREATHFERILSVLNEEDHPITPTRARLRDVFRTLERLGYGQFVVGRRGHSTRFIHMVGGMPVPLIELGKMAQIPAKQRRVKAKRRTASRGKARKIAA